MKPQKTWLAILLLLFASFALMACAGGADNAGETPAEYIVEEPATAPTVEEEPVEEITEEPVEEPT